MENKNQKFYTQALVTSLVFLQKDIVSLWLKEEGIARAARPGQFVSLYSGDKSRLLPRPISICRTKPEEGKLRLVFRIAGSGTLEFSKLNAGDKIDIAGPLGNGYDLLGSGEDTAIVIGGGIGIPPMLALSEELGRINKNGINTEIVLGYRDSNTFLSEEFKGLGNIHIATEDGSLGTKGNVVDALRSEGIKGKAVYACGPLPMLRGVSDFAQKEGIKAYISLEEKMACGIGACLACICKTKDVDKHSNVKNKRICADGPVFDSRDIEWE